MDFTDVALTALQVVSPVLVGLGSRKHQGGPRCAGGLLLDPSGVDE
jgi:hypothetical protein